MPDHLTYHGDPGRTGRCIVHGYSPSEAKWKGGKKVVLGERVVVEPLFVEGFVFQGHVRDIVILATTSNGVYVFDEGDLIVDHHAPLLHVDLGEPGKFAGTPPGLVGGPLGIQSTPVFDRHARRLYLIATRENLLAQPVYVAYVVDLDRGEAVAQAVLASPPGSSPRFDGSAQDQRGALNLVDGWVFATFADVLGGDVGGYHGWIVAFAADDPTRQLFWPLTRSITGAGAFAAGGAVAGKSRLFVTTGNALGAEVAKLLPQLSPGELPAEKGEYIISVVAVQPPTPGEPSPPIVDWFQPTNWLSETEGNSDEDFGGSTPVAFTSAAGYDLLAFVPKDGNVYLLDQNRLGNGDALWVEPNVFGAGSGGTKAPAAHLQLRRQDGTLVDRLFFMGFGGPGLAAFDVGSGPVLDRAENGHWQARGPEGRPIPGGDSAGALTVVFNPDLNSGVVFTIDVRDGIVADARCLRGFDVHTGVQVVDLGDLGFSYSNWTPGGPFAGFPHLVCSGEALYVPTLDGVIVFVRRGAKARPRKPPAPEPKPKNAKRPVPKPARRPVSRIHEPPPHGPVKKGRPR